MNLLAFVVAGWILGLLTGAALVPLFNKIGRIGKSFFILVNPRTKTVQPRWAKAKGGVADFKFADDTPKSVVLDGPLAHTHKGRSAFLVNTEAGVAFNILTDEAFKPAVLVDANGKPILDPTGKEQLAPVPGKDEPHEGMTPGVAGKTRTPHLNGARLNAVRKDTRVQQIAASNRMDLALVAKVVMFGMVFLGLIGIATLWLLSGLAKHNGG